MAAIITHVCKYLTWLCETINKGEGGATGAAGGGGAAGTMM